MMVFSRFTRYFTEVARSGSLRRASERLHVSASAIDRQILQAEQALGMPLFERLPGGLRPTAAGELLLAATRRWAAEGERLSAQMNDLLGLRRGHVRIAVIDALARGVMAAEIARMRGLHPGISFSIRVLDNADVLGAVLAGEVDFGLLLDPQGAREVVVRAHGRVVPGIVCRPEHALAQAHRRTGAGCRFSAVAELPMVVPAETLAIGAQLRLLQAATGIAVDAVAGADDIQMVKSLVSQGVGLGVLASIDVIDEVAAGELAFVPLTDAVLRPLTLALCVARARQLSAAANLMLLRLEEVLPDMVGMR